MAHKKAAGSTSNNRESQSKRLGVKIFGNSIAKPGNIIIRQRGTAFHPGAGVRIGKDHTIFATIEGKVKFARRKVKAYTGLLKLRTFVSVEAGAAKKAK
jgi:large subunit ribosomal protein L27